MKTDGKEPEAKVEEVVEETSVSKDLSDEIDGAVDDVMTKREADEAAAKGEDLPEEEEENDLPPEDDEIVAVDNSSDVTDSDLERAVKAGMTMATARTFKDAKALNEVVTMLEPKGKESEVDDEEASELSDVETLLETIPDLDPEVYDEKVVAGFKALKGIVALQGNTIKSLQDAGSVSNANVFDVSVKALGDAVNTKLKDQPEKLTALKEKFDMIKAGYKASGKSADHDTAFNEAVAIVLGDVMAGAKDAVKGNKLARRSNGHTARPTGSSTKPGKGDPLKDVADEIDQKYFGKK